MIGLIGEKIFSIEIVAAMTICLLLCCFIYIGYQAILLKKKITYLKSIGFVKQERKYLWGSEYFYVRNQYEDLSEDTIYNTRLKKLKEFYK